MWTTKLFSYEADWAKQIQYGLTDCTQGIIPPNEFLRLWNRSRQGMSLICLLLTNLIVFDSKTLFLCNIYADTHTCTDSNCHIYKWSAHQSCKFSMEGETKSFTSATHQQAYFTTGFVFRDGGKREDLQRLVPLPQDKSENIFLVGNIAFPLHPLCKIQRQQQSS